MIKTMPIKGAKFLPALNAYCMLLMGIKMTPANYGIQFEDFYHNINKMPVDDQEKIFRQAIFLVKMDEDEVKAMLTFCADANGIPYSNENIKNLEPAALIDSVVAVCQAIAAFRIELVTEAEKKNLKIGQ